MRIDHLKDCSGLEMLFFDDIFRSLVVARKLHNNKASTDMIQAHDGFEQWRMRKDVPRYVWYLDHRVNVTFDVVWNHCELQHHFLGTHDTVRTNTLP